MMLAPSQFQKNIVLLPESWPISDERFLVIGPLLKL
jgi:hypothetical protein